jgi:hypothetical protein
MPTADDVASIDAMRDMDEEDGTEGVAQEGTYLFNVQTSYAVTATSEDEAYDILMENEAEDRIRVLDQDVMYVGED